MLEFSEREIVGVKIDMKLIRKLFHILIALIMIPTLLFVGAILWSYSTGNSITLPSFSGSRQEDTNFLLDAQIQSADVYTTQESGEERTAVGIRGYIWLSKNDLSAMTPSQYLEFYQKSLKNSDYLWFSFICPDGTGLFIPNCSDGSACFCKLDEQGRQESIYGYLIVQGDRCFYQEAK